MARSRKRHPVAAVTTATSEKEDKQRASRRRRRVVRCELLQSVHILEGELSPEPRRDGRWMFAKDGKVWLPGSAAGDRRMRK